MNAENESDFSYEDLLGVGFNNHLKSLGIIPQPGETSWQFRKRAFPIIWERTSPNLAMAFLLLLPRNSWSKKDMDRYLKLTASNPSRKDLKRFVRRFPCDPIASRGYRATTDWMMREIVNEIKSEPPPIPPRTYNDKQQEKRDRELNYALENIRAKLEVN